LVLFGWFGDTNRRHEGHRLSNHRQTCCVTTERATPKGGPAIPSGTKLSFGPSPDCNRGAYSTER
jgi:hypothetical protein